MNRVRLVHEDYPLFVDCSIVKSSKRKGYKMVPEYTIQEANVFQNVESYEIEIEMDNYKKNMEDRVLNNVGFEIVKWFGLKDDAVPH